MDRNFNSQCKRKINKYKCLVNKHLFPQIDKVKGTKDNKNTDIVTAVF